MQRLKVAAYRIQKELLELIKKDADAFSPLAGAYRMPRETAEERETKARVMEAALKEASLVPLDIMKCCGEALDYLRELADKGSKLAVSDAACGAILAKAAMQAAWMNVCMNTNMIKDKQFAARVDAEGRALLQKYLPFADKIYEDVESAFTNLPALQDTP
jgi:formiminotetrahydrofolate cyclodeaminase